MSKSQPTMKCAICKRPLARAAALKSGLPVGRVCATKAGLIKPRPAAQLQMSLPTIERDTQTIDLFPTP